MPVVSVVIPTYNRADLIADTINSILAQTFRDLEIIVVDDGSTDDTMLVVAQYQNVVKYVRKENGGEASARNLGIKLAQGKYIACLDSDDLWQPIKLERQVAFLESKGYQWVYCDAELFDGSTGHTFGLYSQQHHPHYDKSAHVVAQKLIMDDFIPCPSPLLHRSIFHHVGYFDESHLLRMRSDWEMWLRVAARYPLGYIPEALARYRIHPGSASRQENIQLLHQSQIQVIKNALTYAPDVYLSVKPQALAAQYVRTGRSFVGQGNVIEARQMFAQAIRSYPLQISAYGFGAATIFGKQATEWLRTLNRWRRLSNFHSG